MRREYVVRGKRKTVPAAHRADARVTLETATVAFDDVPEDETTTRAIVWRCFSPVPLTFKIVAGPTPTSEPAGRFRAVLGDTLTIPAPGLTTGSKARLWLAYHGAVSRATAAGSVRVRCLEVNEEWEIALSARSVERPRSAVMLVLDQSSSMDWDAGNGRKRVEVLREAAYNAIELIEPGHGIGIVRFDHEAHVGMAVAEAGPELLGAGRSAATAEIARHCPNPLGATSIGGGIALAAAELSAAAGYDRTAMIVLADSQENAPRTIADVAANVDDCVFGIGMSAPDDLDPQALDAVANATGGHAVMTGELDATEPFALSKYALQALAGATSREVVLDTRGWLQPGNAHEQPFWLTEADAGVDVIVLSPAPWALRARLETPSGEQIHAAAPPSQVKFVLGMGIAFFRFALPLELPAGAAAGVGRWVLHLRYDGPAVRKHLSMLLRDPRAYTHARAHGLAWSAIVHARSSLKFHARLEQTDIGLGHTMHLAARLLEYDLPVEARAEVSAELVTPSGTHQVIRLLETLPGRFEAEVIGAEYGIHRYRIVASGKSLRGSRFTREQSLTGSIYVARPPVYPAPSAEPDPARAIAALVDVVGGNRRLARLLERELERHRVRLVDLVRALETVADAAKPERR